jgi:hypothetical protein
VNAALLAVNRFLATAAEIFTTRPDRQIQFE